jgi:hypothetical protein
MKFIQELVSLANSLDKRGMKKEADMVDKILFANRQWTRKEVEVELPKVKVTVVDDPAIKEGTIIPDGNNPFVVVKLKDGKRREKKFDWEAILQVLNDPKTSPLWMDRSDPSPAVPKIASSDVDLNFKKLKEEAELLLTAIADALALYQTGQKNDSAKHIRNSVSKGTKSLLVLSTTLADSLKD